ncbi:MAG TPA: putative lipid II flippase FtsW [Patescibacteria group bacterium]|jgi:cell division protein FtsW
MARAHRPDYTFFLTVVALSAFGLLMILSAGQVQSFQLKGNGYYYFTQQLGSLLVGLLAFYVAQRVHYQVWKKLALPLLLAAVALLLVLFIPGVGFEHGGARRWIDLGVVPLQVSEVAKLALVVYLAAWLSGRRKKDDFTGTFLPFAAVTALLGGLIMLQPDLGTTAVLAGTALTMYFTAGAPLRHIGMSFAGLFGVVAVLIATAPYRINRFLTFLDPSKDTQGTGYHVQQALVAIGSGGLFGVGFNNSLQKNFYLPEPMNDSIFAVIGEELGFLASVALLATFAFLARRGLRIARYAPDDFGRLLVTGFITWVTLQAIVNVAAMLSLIPLTGVTLPFISLGGSSLVVLLTAMGIVMNVSRHTVAGGKEASHASIGRRRGNRRTRHAGARSIG